MPGAPTVYIVVLNFRGADDTIACLRSLDRLTYRDFKVIVVDNASGDDSVPRIAAMQHELSCAVELLPSPVNGGFAAGNNIGLRAALARGDGAYCWLLNNDTTVDPGSLGALVDAAEDDRRAGRRVGQYGAKLRDAAHPDVIQGVGNTYNRWFAITTLIGEGEPDRGQYDTAPSRADLVNGASLFVRDDFVRQVGLLTEDYFLYFEEHDWTARARRAGWGLRIVPQSIVYHKLGASTGANGSDRTNKSLLSDYCSIRSRLLFTARYHPFALPTVYLALFGSIVLRAIRGQWDRVPMIVRLAVTFWRAPARPAL